MAEYVIKEVVQVERERRLEINEDIRHMIYDCIKERIEPGQEIPDFSVEDIATIMREEETPVALKDVKFRATSGFEYFLVDWIFDFVYDMCSENDYIECDSRDIWSESFVEED